MKIIKNMSRAMEEFCRLELENPELSTRQLAEKVNSCYLTCLNWVASPVYKEYRANLLKEQWKDATKKALTRMIGLINSEREDIALKASQYLLDSNGYKAPEQVELNNNIIKVTLDD